MDVHPKVLELITLNAGWIAAAILVVAGSLASSYVRQWFTSHEFGVVRLRKNAQKDQTIYEILWRLLYNADADRAYVFRFHNGGHFAGGLSFMKASCTHEVVREGVSREIMNLKDIPLSSVPEFVNMITHTQEYFELCVNDLPSSYFRSHLEAQGIKFIVIERIIVGGQLLGFIGVDFCKDVPTKFEDTECINMAAHIIEQQLSGQR